MTTKACPTCHGSGTVPDNDVPCGATIIVGHETFDCWAKRAHPGWPHMRILAAPCAACGGYDEHHDSCVVYPAEPAPYGRDGWYSWADDSLAVSFAFPIGGRAENDLRPVFMP